MEVIISRRRSKSDVTFYIVMYQWYQKNIEVDYPEEHAKTCYFTWRYIDMNDGKLPQDDLKTFDDWKQSSGCISTSVGSYPRMTYPSPTFHTTVFALSGVAI